MIIYKFGEVVLVDFPQSGNGYRKRRPALAVLDIGDADVVMAPITTKERSGQGDYKLIDWSSSGLLQESWVRLAKIVCLDKSDITCRLGQFTDYDKNILATLWQSLYTF
ncbi:type II toxin-antitoxin system PemK/MazF family toxin [bacterium]|nr:type II toxin-antitoxin system PemK/MazF family toxin [bacterium]